MSGDIGIDEAGDGRRDLHRTKKTAVKDDERRKGDDGDAACDSP